jgi:hypothetical protein
MEERSGVGQAERADAVAVRCAWCGRLRVDGEWRGHDDFEAIALLASVTGFSDGICPDCLATFTDRTA